MGNCNQKQKFEGNDHIPEKILTDILKRLSVRSLSRFQCVCKGWNGLIKSPFFVNLHLNHQKSNQNVDDYMLMKIKYMKRSIQHDHAVVSFYSPGLLQIDAPAGFPVFPHPRLDICGPCNGIICFVADRYVGCHYANYGSGEGAIYLCNPATRECRKLPPRPFVSSYDKVRRVACGFGVDPRTDAYKVVSVMFCCDEFRDDIGIYRIEVFDLSSNSWREVEMVLPEDIPKLAFEDYFSILNGIGVFFNGCLHWMYGDYILGFDLSSEVFRNLGKHDKCKKEVEGTQWHFRSLMVVDDSLAIVDATGPANYYPISVVSVFVMEKYGDEDSWEERYYLGPLKTSLVNPLTATPNHGILLSKSDESLVSFELSPDSYEDDDLEEDGYQLTGEQLSKAKLFYSTIMQAVVISEQTLVSVAHD